MQKKKLLFIHIAKTGGASIRRMLKSSKLKFDYDCIHNNKLIKTIDNKIVRQKLPVDLDVDSYANIAYFVRNPYDRLLSCYCYFYNGGLNQYNTSLHHGDYKTQEIIKYQFPSFKDCCHNLKDFCLLVTHARPMSNSILNKYISPSKHRKVILGRFEFYNKDVISLFSQIGLSIQPNDILKINLASNRKQFLYDDSMKQEVYKFYKNDFERFNYEK